MTTAITETISASAEIPRPIHNATFTPPGQIATLRGSQLKEAAETLDRVAGEMSTLSVAADVSDPLGDVAAAIRVVREDLDALEALGYRDRVHEM